MTAARDDALAVFPDGGVPGTKLVGDVQQAVQAANFAMGLIKGFIQIAIAGVAFPAELVLRTQFGERYLSLTRAMIAGVFLVGPMMFMHPANAATLLYAFTFVFIAQYALVIARNRRGIRWHSHSVGISWLNLVAGRPVVRAWVIDFVIEPGVVYAAAIFVTSHNAYAGLYLQFAASALLIQTAMMYARSRERLLDAIDQQIESQHLAEALEGTTHPKETDGFVVPGASTWSRSERASIADAFHKLDPRVRAMLEPKPEIDPLDTESVADIAPVAGDGLGTPPHGPADDPQSRPTQQV